MKKKASQSSLASFVMWFFAMITTGGLMLSFGTIGIIKWFREKPYLLSPLAASVALLLGLAIDFWAIWSFLKKRDEFNR
ncbi:MAG: hypothetical protein JNN15_13760 [Blastocatellia bacterium]|nr:hypothetical protein [Blastocatellia bacterium]